MGGAKVTNSATLLPGQGAEQNSGISRQHGTLHERKPLKSHCQPHWSIAPGYLRSSAYGM